MPYDPFDPNDVFQTIVDVGKRQIPKDPEGIIKALRPTIAYVQPIGSTRLIPCELNGIKDISVDKRCTYQQIPGRTTYRLTSIFAFGGALPPTTTETGGELSPPSDLATSDQIAGNILLSWNAPPQQAVAFEVEYNTTATDVGATSALLTRGSYFIKESAVELFFRVRSVNTLFLYSSWTEWVSGTPGENPAQEDLIDRILTDDDGNPLADDDGNLLIGD